MSEENTEKGSAWKERLAMLFRDYEKYGIGKEDYLRLKLYEKPKGERLALYRLDQHRTEERKRLRRQCIALIKNKDHCPGKAAGAKLDRIRHRLETSYETILELKLWSFSEDRLEEDYARARKQRQEELREEKHGGSEAEKQYFVHQVMEKTGWTETETVSRIEKARAMLACDYDEYFYKEYYTFNLFTMTESEQKGVCLFRDSRNFREKCEENKNLVRILKNKEETNIYFSEFIRRPWCVNSRVSFEEFNEIFRSSTRIIYKPIRGNRGIGVAAYDLTGDNRRAVYEELAQLEDGMVEAFVVQHPRMNALCPASVNTLRVVTLCSKKRPVTVDGKYTGIAYTTLRIGGGTAVVDNYHGGGMCALADLKTGTLITPGINEAGEVFENHPLTGTPIRGFEIPCYKEALAMVAEACRKSEVAGYLGWDVAITENGPVLIEANTMPAIGLLTAPCSVEKISSKAFFEKFV